MMSPGGGGRTGVEGSVDKPTIERKSKSMWREYFSILDLSELELCISELEAPSCHDSLVVCGVNLVLERKTKVNKLI